VPPGVRVRPIALVLGLAIMVVILVFVAVNRSYQVSPSIPAIHQLR
jgi:hypothetical protein